MKYFFKLGQGIEVLPLMDRLMRNPDFWNQNEARTTFEGTPHADVQDILLRFGKTDGNDLDVIDTPAMKVFDAKRVALTIMALVGGSRLGRVVITKLASGKKILPHADTEGLYAKYYTRYHLVLQGFPGSLFLCGDETVQMLTGELWWFDASAEHCVMNNSADDRIHMLVDVRIDP